MYFRWSSESKPAWNGSSRALFQNNNNHKMATTSMSICSGDRAENFLELTFQSNVPTEVTAIRTIQTGQAFFTALNVRSPSATELPSPGIFTTVASVARRQEEP